MFLKLRSNSEPTKHRYSIERTAIFLIIAIFLCFVYEKWKIVILSGSEYKVLPWFRKVFTQVITRPLKHENGSSSFTPVAPSLEWLITTRKSCRCLKWIHDTLYEYESSSNTLDFRGKMLPGTNRSAMSVVNQPGNKIRFYCFYFFRYYYLKLNRIMLVKHSIRN